MSLNKSIDFFQIKSYRPWRVEEQYACAFSALGHGWWYIEAKLYAGCAMPTP